MAWRRARDGSSAKCMLPTTAQATSPATNLCSPRLPVCGIDQHSAEHIAETPEYSEMACGGSPTSLRTNSVMSVRAVRTHHMCKKHSLCMCAFNAHSVHISTRSRTAVCWRCCDVHTAVHSSLRGCQLIRRTLSVSIHMVEWCTLHTHAWCKINARVNQMIA